MTRVQNKLARTAVRALLVVFGLSPFSANARTLPPEEKVQAQYYRLLGSIVTASPDTQIASLQNFLLSLPNFERAYLKLLEQYQKRKRVNEAKAYFQALATNPVYQRNSLWALAKIAIMEGETRQAFDYFSSALRLAPPPAALLRDFVEFDMQQGEAFNGFAALRNLGLSPENQKTGAILYEHQRQNFPAALTALRELPQEISHQFVLLHVWGDSFYRSKQRHSADSLWERSLALAQRSNDLEAQALFLTNRGLVANAEQRPDLALSYYDSAEAMARQTDDLYHRQRILGFRSNLRYARNEYTETAALAEEAGQLAAMIGAYNFAASWFLNAGQALYESGRFNEALQAYDQSEKYTRRLHTRDGLIRLNHKKAAIYIYLNLHEVAKNILQEAHTLAEQTQHVEFELRTQVLFADMMVSEKNYVEARKRYQKFIDFLEATASFPLERHNYFAKIADTYRTEEKYDEAKAFYQQARASAVEIDSPAFEAWYTLEIANIDLKIGSLPEAINQFNRALKTATAANLPDMLIHVYMGLGDAHQKANDLNKAIAAYLRAAKIIEATRTELSVDALRIGYFSEKSWVYRKLAEAFFQRHQVSASHADLDSLFYYAQMTQGRALFDLRLRTSTGSNDTLYQRACTQLRLIQRALRADPNKYDSLRASLEAARYSLMAQRLRLVEQFGDTSQTRISLAQPLEKMQSVLKGSALGLLLYRISDETAYVTVVTGHDAKVVRLQTSLSPLAMMVDSLIAPLHQVKEDSIQFTPFRAGLAHRLYEVLIKPVEQTVALPERLLIVPDLALMNLPFEMLLTRSPEQSQYFPDETPAYADGFLLHRYTIVYSPMASLLLEKMPKPATDPDILIFANPFREIKTPALNQSRLPVDWRFVPLPFSQEESEKIRAIYPRAQIYVREDASEDRFKREAPKHRILHIASHAFVDIAFDAFSELVLAAGPDSTDDGLLMGYEIADLQLSCDLIVLSACKTGVGKIVDGEGVLGLPRLFLGADAKSVLMTQWQVYDQFAAILMPKFYEEFLTGQRSKAEALARAKRALVNDKTAYNGLYYQHPFYWATFVLYGDPGMDRGLSTPATPVLILASLLLLALLLAGIYYQRFKRLPTISRLRAAINR